MNDHPRPTPFTAVRVIARDEYTNPRCMGNLIGKTGCIIPIDIAKRKYGFSGIDLIPVMFRKEDMNEYAKKENRRTWGYLPESLSTEDISPEEAFELVEMAKEELSQWRVSQ